MIDLPERIFAAAALAIAPHMGCQDCGTGPGECPCRNAGRAALTAALAVAEAEGAGVFVVPGICKSIHPQDDGWNQCRAAMLAGKVAL